MGRRYRGIMALHRMNALRCGDAMARLAADPVRAMMSVEQGAIILVSLRESNGRHAANLSIRCMS